MSRCTCCIVSLTMALVALAVLSAACAAVPVLPGGGAPSEVKSCCCCSSGLTFGAGDRKSTRLNSSHTVISYAVFCLKKKKRHNRQDSFNLTTTYVHKTL